MHSTQFEKLVLALNAEKIDVLIFGKTPMNIQGCLTKGDLAPSEISNYRKKKFICLTQDPLLPLYFGIFVPDIKLPYMCTTQDTLLHVTCLFMNNKVEVPESFDQYIGHTINLNIIGISFNKSGYCLMVERNHPLLNDVQNPHITLHTNPGSRPVDVGKNAVEPIMFSTPIEVTGVFSPYW
jgi:hypothetical protein